MTITKLHPDLIEGLDDLMPSGGYIPLEGTEMGGGPYKATASFYKQNRFEIK